MPIDFITSNPALDQFNVQQKAASDQGLADAHARLFGEQATELQASRPTKLRTLSAEADKAEVGAKYAEPEAQGGLRRVNAAADLAETNAGVAKETAMPLARANTRKADAEATNAMLQGYYKSSELLANGQDEMAQQVANAIGQPIPPEALQNNVIRHGNAAIAKRAQEAYPEAPGQQQQFIEGQLSGIDRRIKAGEDPMRVWQDFATRGGVYKMPEGMTPAASSQKPMIVPPGGTLVEPNTGRTIAQGKAGSFDAITLNQMADQYLAGDKSVFQNLGRGQQAADNIVALRGHVAQKLADQGKGGADQAAALANFQAQSGAALTSARREANVASSVEEAKQTFPLALEASAAVPRTQWVPINRMMQMWREQTSSPEQSRFAVANQGVITAYSQAMSRTGTNSVNAQQHAEALLSKVTGPEAYAGAIHQMELEMHAALSAPEVVRRGILNRISGRPGEGPPPVNPAPTQTPSAAPAGLQEGATATNPNTGQKIIFRNGQWVPAQ